MEIDEKRSVEILIEVLDAMRIPYRRVNPGEEGGFFYTDVNGQRKKFTTNIFTGKEIVGL